MINLGYVRHRGIKFSELGRKGVPNDSQFISTIYQHSIRYHKVIRLIKKRIIHSKVKKYDE